MQILNNKTLTLVPEQGVVLRAATEPVIRASVSKGKDLNQVIAQLENVLVKRANYCYEKVSVHLNPKELNFEFNNSVKITKLLVELYYYHSDSPDYKKNLNKGDWLLFYLRKAYPTDMEIVFNRAVYSIRLAKTENAQRLSEWYLQYNEDDPIGYILSMIQKLSTSEQSGLTLYKERHQLLERIIYNFIAKNDLLNHPLFIFNSLDFSIFIGLHILEICRLYHLNESIRSLLDVSPADNCAVVLLI
ncbi:hypothetical protein OAR19_00225 [bacterium]|nr:hypothetical protein [bacterium]